MIGTDTIGIAILGFGTVGAGVYQLIERQKNELEAQTGYRAVVSRILVRDAARPREGIAAEILTESFEDIIADEKIDIIVEVMGGIEPAYSYITAALKAGKNVVTANKDLMATHGGELMALAHEMEKDLLFEASVAGGIPIIRPMKQCLAGNHITEVMGIINGTTNYILTKMTEEGMDFSEALAKATELGYAEADPTADVEGYDAGRKIAILASIAFHSRVTFSQIYTEGITKITATDIRYAKKTGRVIKLLGTAKETADGLEVSVQPMLLPVGHPLASVRDAFNAVLVHGDAVDDVMFYGRGAGRFPTASACMGDIIDIMRNIRCQCTSRIGCGCYRHLSVKPMQETMHRYYLRIQLNAAQNAVETVSSVFEEYGICIREKIQKPGEGESRMELVLITDSARESSFSAALEQCLHRNAIQEISSRIRIYA